MRERPRSLIIGGKAGEGVKKVAQVISEVLNSLGLYSFQMDDYQSLIKGGHNFSVVSFASDPVFNSYAKAELIICFDQRSLDLHRDSLSPSGSLYYNQDGTLETEGIGLALSSLMKETGVSNVSIAALTIFFAHYGLDQDLLYTAIRRSYKRDVEVNLLFAEKVFGLITLKGSLPVPKPDSKPGKLLSGNQAIALGAWAAGLDFYFAYPMTPASSLLHYYAARKDLGVYAIHAESELAAANMAVGAVVAGARAAVGSSGGGFALMQEAFSLAGMVEAPLLCVLSSRPGPATGVSTYTAQEDLNFALHQGHGEFCRIVASPDSFERAFTLASELLCLAWKFQIPVILLTEKHLSESLTGVRLELSKIEAADPQTPESPEDYKRYQISSDGISPLLFPPADQIIKWNSHEHLESGLRTDQAEAVKAMKDKRQRKRAGIAGATLNYQRVAKYGSGHKLIFAYGSTVLELREALKLLPDEYSIISLIYLDPFPYHELEAFQGSEALVAEHSQSGAFSRLLQEKLGLKTIGHLNRYDGRSFDPEQLAKQIEEGFHA